MMNGGADPRDLLLDILHGNLCKGFPDPPSRIVKIFVCSTCSDFIQERRQLHENVFPEVQRFCSNLGLDLQTLDPHWNLSSGDSNRRGSVFSYLEGSSNLMDSFEFYLQMKEIQDCYRLSLDVFFLCLVGHKYRPWALPTTIDSQVFAQIHRVANDAGLEDAALLTQWYKKDLNSIPEPKYTLMNIEENRTDHSDICQLIDKRLIAQNYTSGDSNKAESRVCDQLERVARIVEYGAKVVSREDREQFSSILSAVHTQVKLAISLVRPGEEGRLACFVRRFKGIQMNNTSLSSYFDVTPASSPSSSSLELPTSDISPDSAFGLRQLLEDLICSSKRNIHFFTIPWNELRENRDLSTSTTLSDGLTPTTTSATGNLPIPRKYTEQFVDCIQNTLTKSIEESVNRGNSYFEYIPEIIRESHSCLCNTRKLMSNIGLSQSLDVDCSPLLTIQSIMRSNCDDKTLSPSSLPRHSPIVVVGPEGVGKSTLLSQVFVYCSEWLSEEAEQVVKVVRHIGQSPSSSYASELLRSLCIHITLVYGFEMRTDIVYELSSLSLWFQDLLKMIETSCSNVDLVIVLDDLHLLRFPQTTAILGWLPWNLPPSVHLICSVLNTAESVVNILRSRIPGDNFVRLPSITSSSSLVNMIQCKLKDKGRTLSKDQWQVVGQRFSEIDFQQHPTSPLYASLVSQTVLIKWHSADNNTAQDIPCDVDSVVNAILTQCEIKFGSSLMERLASYLTSTRYGLREAELQDLVFSEDAEGTVNVWLGIKHYLQPLLKEFYILGRPYLHWSHSCISESVRKRYLFHVRTVKRVHSKLANAFYLGFTEVLHNQNNAEKCSRKDSFDILREIDEVWYHLLESGDIHKLKTQAILNIDFIMASVRSSSISYLRSMLELVRASVLDWEIDLIYYMTKQSVNIVSQNTDQLAIEILLWLRPFASAISDSASKYFVEEKDRQYLEMLVAGTYEWCNNYPSAMLIPTSSWLHLPLPMQVSVITCPLNITQAILSVDHQNLIFCNAKSHKETITCLQISDSGRYLVTGSEDTSVVLWELTYDGIVECKVKYRLNHHVAGVLCTAITHSEQLILSGSVIGAVCVVRLESGTLIGRLEHHRGMITCICVNYEDDIFATGSTDNTVTIWSLETLCVLNQIFLPKAILHMDISLDSTFLMLALEDNKVHVRALTTGSEIHILQEHQNNAIISFLKFAWDSSRAIIGTGDGKLQIYDVHSAQLLQTLSSHQDMVTSIIHTPCDKYLVTCGNSKVILWNFYERKKVDSALGMCLPLEQNGVTNNSNSNNNNNNNLPGKASIASRSNGSNSQTASLKVWSSKVKRFEHHQETINCVAVSRDGSYAVTGARDCLVKVWNLTTRDIHATLSGHEGSVTCVAFAQNGFFCVSGSEDRTLRVWSLTLGLKFFVFREHQSCINAVFVTNDSKKILSVDAQGYHRLWQADSGNQVLAVPKLINKVMMFSNMVFTVGGKNDNSLRYWSVFEPDVEKFVSHTEPITCYTCTYDNQTIITGSQDTSLKVWEVATGKLTQVLVGHEEAISCVVSTPMCKSVVVSGSQDCNLIVWDTTTGNVTFTLTGHTANIINVAISIDGVVAVSASEDNTLMVWNISDNGQRIAVLDIHHTMSCIKTSFNLNQIVIQLKSSNLLPIIKFHNNPSKVTTLDLPPGTPSLGDKLSPHLKGLLSGLTGSGRRGRGNLKREQSLDSFCWDQLHKGVSIDNFRKLSALQQGNSPMGSREHLATTGIIWDGTSSSFDRSFLSRPLRLMGPKSGGPKQKILKKQQSMFAFFPEHFSSAASSIHTPGSIRTQSPLTSQPTQTSTQTSGVGSGAGGGGGVEPLSSKSSATKLSSGTPLLTKGLPSRSQSLEDTQTNDDDQKSQAESFPKLEVVKDSLICRIS